VKAARFTSIVEACGKPDLHLVLIEPSKDRALQSAVKAGRVMTVLQESVGTKSDQGVIGFQAGPGRQFLLFPKSLRRFAGARVVGIKYDLIAASATAKAERRVRRVRKGTKAKHAPSRSAKRE
jgi:hypothetical protein